MLKTFEFITFKYHFPIHKKIKVKKKREKERESNNFCITSIFTTFSAERLISFQEK